jgi:hypothetical protein
MTPTAALASVTILFHSGALFLTLATLWIQGHSAYVAVAGLNKAIA